MVWRGSAAGGSTSTGAAYAVALYRATAAGYGISSGSALGDIAGPLPTGEVTILAAGPAVRRYSAAFAGDRYGAELVERGRYAAVAGRIRYDAEPALDRVEAQA